MLFCHRSSVVLWSRRIWFPWVTIALVVHLNSAEARHARFNTTHTLTISGNPASTAEVSEAYTFTPAATDARHRSLKFAIRNKPAWAGFNTANGTLSGTPSAADVGLFDNIGISVSDGYSRASLAPFSIRVTEQSGQTTTSPSAPTITGNPAASVIEGSLYTFQPVANDTDGDALSFSVQNKPSWANFSIASGLLSGTPTTIDVGTYANIKISVSDGVSSAALPAFSITVNSAQVATNPAGSVTLSWIMPLTDAAGSPIENLAGYYVYYGTSTGSLSHVVTVADPTATSVTIANLTPGIWYFRIRSYTSTGEVSSPTDVLSAIL